MALVNNMNSSFEHKKLELSKSPTQRPYSLSKRFLVHPMREPAAPNPINVIRNPLKFESSFVQLPSTKRGIHITQPQHMENSQTCTEVVIPYPGKS